jgi:hypothetical protein
MNELLIIIGAVLISIFLIIIITYFSGKESFYYPAFNTYVNSPRNVGVYPMMPNLYPSWYDIDWKPWRSRYPFLYSPASQVGASPNYNVWNTPMLTSVKSPRDYLIGRWVNVGIAYSNKDNEKTDYLDIYQLNIDPSRELYSYEARTKFGQRLPIEMSSKNPNAFKLEDGDKFKVIGNDKIWTFVEDSPYMYVYT